MSCLWCHCTTLNPGEVVKQGVIVGGSKAQADSAFLKMFHPFSVFYFSFTSHAYVTLLDASTDEY